MPESKFCRRCGAVVTATAAAAAFNSSELPTALLDQRSDPTTQNLSPRVTSPETPKHVMDASSDVGGDPKKQAKRKRNILIGSAVALLLLCGLIASVAYVKVRSNNATEVDTALIYPGSQTVAAFSSGDGSTLQLQTNDSLEKVVAWYEKSIKPTKTMRLTSTSVVLKNGNVTTTVASEAGKTNILIKRPK
jgi:hypothetical protein